MKLKYTLNFIKMKCICIGDVHVKVSNVPEVEDMINRILEIAKKVSPNFIVVLGDVLDRHSVINVHCLIRAEELILSLSKIAPTFLIIGNHDRPNNSNYLTTEHPFNSMKFWNNVYVIDKVKSYVISNSIREDNQLKQENEYRFIFAPYVYPGRFNEALSTIENPFLNTTCIFGHQEILKAKMGGIVSSIGDPWPLENPLLICGHIHDYDLLQPNMIYVGTPIQHAFGDNGDKTISIFTFNEQGWSQDRIDLGLKKRIIVYIEPGQVNDYQVPKDKLVKLVIKGEEALIRTVMKLDKIQKLKKEGVKVVFKTIQSEIKTVPFTFKMSYKDRFLSELKDENCIKWFNKLF